MGYVGMGNFLLRQIDILIAIWDGEAAKPGGTGAVVMTAVEEKIPVVWISMDPDRVPSMLERFEPEGNPIVSSADVEAVRSKRRWHAFSEHRRRLIELS